MYEPNTLEIASNKLPVYVKVIQEALEHVVKHKNVNWPPPGQ
jgi:hypothetical protein